MYPVWHQLTGLKPKAEHFGLCYALAFAGECVGGAIGPEPGPPSSSHATHGLLLTHQAKPAPSNKHFLDGFYMFNYYFQVILDAIFGHSNSQRDYVMFVQWQMM